MRASLTARENETAELLFLYETTAETHLRNIFRKFDVTYRADVAPADREARRC